MRWWPIDVNVYWWRVDVNVRWWRIDVEAEEDHKDQKFIDLERGVAKKNDEYSVFIRILTIVEARRVNVWKYYSYGDYIQVASKASDK